MKEITFVVTSEFPEKLPNIKVEEYKERPAFDDDEITNAVDRWMQFNVFSDKCSKIIIERKVKIS